LFVPTLVAFGVDALSVPPLKACFKM